MATQTHKPLATGIVSSGIVNVYVVPNTTTTYVKEMLFYNSNVAQQTLEVYLSGAGAIGRCMRRVLNTDETLEWAPNYPLIIPASGGLAFKTTTSGVVNYFVYGMEEV